MLCILQQAQRLVQRTFRPSRYTMHIFAGATALLVRRASGRCRLLRFPVCFQGRARTAHLVNEEVHDEPGENRGRYGAFADARHVSHGDKRNRAGDDNAADVEADLGVAEIPPGFRGDGCY